jgi:hypothetical protein
MSDIYQMQASDDFSRARGRALLHRIRHFMSVDRDKLLSLNDVREILKPKSETYRGMQAVPIKLIVGSEGRYRDFNKYFLPRSEHLRQRWERVDIARLENVTLPPIQLYEIGGVYFVRDGNHRVSVACSQGVEIIDAEVTSLSSEIPISPSMTQDDLRAALIAYEKKIFYEKTDFLRLTGCADLDFSSTGRYDVIYNHILVHKYYMNEKASGEIPFSEALVSWSQDVYKPIVTIIREERLYLHFPGRTSGDLYVWIVQHWDFLKKKYGLGFSLREATRDFSKKYGVAREGPLAFLKRVIDRLTNKKGER